MNNFCHINKNKVRMMSFSVMAGVFLSVHAGVVCFAVMAKTAASTNLSF